MVTIVFWSAPAIRLSSYSHLRMVDSATGSVQSPRFFRWNYGTHQSSECKYQLWRAKAFK